MRNARLIPSIGTNVLRWQPDCRFCPCLSVAALGLRLVNVTNSERFYNADSNAILREDEKQAGDAEMSDEFL